MLKIKLKNWQRPVLLVSVLLGLTLSGCGFFDGLDQMAEASPSGNIAVSLDQTGSVTVHMIACDIQVESVELLIQSTTPGDPPLSERINLKHPQGGYVELRLPASTSNNPPVLNSIIADPQLEFWVIPITYKGGEDEHRFVPELSGITIAEVENHPRGTLLVQNYVAGTHDPITLDEVTLDAFKDGPANSRPPGCTVE
ncbi:Uncharacterised protein [Corynebacterium striatum]|uniref:Uncharacterized protein n=1 Tax=Corynebacterium striatum TaxID=43770 RepID=A0AAQ1Z824_CORST|nr:hypothetical protein [Corynebacterium striatum]EEI78815.1 hypothetical protein HMPREF0308_0910 [Corynebacterium striatum ATCC 6940]QQE53935.1 hypothetical protein I6I11_04940 [Corynebacterium striatum]GEA43293.1 hypothetical protein Cst04h_14630 [Corynebacterium striatum]STD62572.1 Uncharacterised protein [Corynebacterium striatum]